MANKELKAAEEHLAALGYYFNDALQMRQVANDEGFEFRNQAHYEELGDSVAAYIQALMVAKYGMQRVLITQEQGVKVVEETEEEEGKEREGVPIFVSTNAQEAKAVLVLVCGSGAVMAGQWARKLCMNDSLHEGSVLPLLVWAAEREIATVVLNPNFRPDDGPRISAEHHVIQAWDQVVAALPAKHVAMVAHSYGGVCACRLLSVREREVLGRLRCIAFTDSVHGTWGPDILSSAAKRFFVRDCVNWVQSDEPLDTLVEAEFLPKEDREPKRKSERNSRTEAELGTGKGMEPGNGTGRTSEAKGLEVETGTGTEPETEPDTKTGSAMEAEPAGLSLYDEELADVASDVTPKDGGKGAAVEASTESVSGAEIGAAAEGLGFGEKESADVTMDEGAGPSGSARSDESGQVLDLSDKAGMAAAIEKERDPGLKATLRKLAGENPSDDVSDGAASNARGADAGDVSGAATRTRAPGARVGGRGRDAGGEKLKQALGRKAQKSGFSWAKLGRNKEYCRCREVSAGVEEHERTTHGALESVKEFLSAKLTAAGAELH